MEFNQISLEFPHYESYTVSIKFPKALSYDKKHTYFYLSLTEAELSGFLKLVLCSERKECSNVCKSNDFSTANPCIEITIPETFYENLRYNDIVFFLKLWKAEEVITEYMITHNEKYNFYGISKIAQALSLDEDHLPFLKLLNKHYMNK